MKTVKTALKYLMAILYILAGINHFVKTGFYLSIMPAYLPWHLALVYISGVIEFVLGAMLLLPKFSRLAAWGVIALLIAVFPANINMAVNPQLFPDIKLLFLYLRLPLQGVLIVWAYWYTKPVEDSRLKKS
jgi:uncharacterized membrane protein